MIGHYYMIDARYEPIIHKGFPMNNIYSGMREIKGEPDYLTEGAAYFPDTTTDTNYRNHAYYKFSRHDSQYDTTYPYIFCFTTCCLITPCSSFDLFLDPERYKKTFWCQGFRDFTTLLTVNQDDPANPIVYRPLSPVLHVVIGSMLSEPDFYLSGFRYGILNVNPSKQYPSTSQRLDEYKKSTQIFMTLETSQETVSIYQPSIDPYPRRSALLAFESLRDTFNKVNIQYQRRLFSSTDDDKKNQRLLVRDKVTKKIKMIQLIAYIASVINSYHPLPVVPDGQTINFLESIVGVPPQNIPQMLPKIDTLIQLLQTSGLQLNINMPDLSGDATIIRDSAINFIITSPHVASTAVITYYKSPDNKKIKMIQFIAYIASAISRYPRETVLDETKKFFLGNGVPPDNIPQMLLQINTLIELLTTSGFLFNINMPVLSGDATIIRENAINFIFTSPGEAATAIIEYYRSPDKTETKVFEEDLIDYALLCLKKNWLGGMMDNAYETHTTVFGDIRNRRLYYLNDTGNFVFMGLNFFTCRNPNDPANADLYVHKSSFDEVKEEGGFKYPVTVLTLANIYRLDCYYTKPPGNIVKSMSIVYQVSSTIVYTREVTPRILHAMDMQKIPLTFLPDLPEVIAAAPTVMAGGGREKPAAAKPAAKPAAAKPAAAKPAAETVEATVTKPAATNKKIEAAAAKRGKNLKKAEAAAAMPVGKSRARTTSQQETQFIGQELINQVSFLQSQQAHIENLVSTLRLVPDQLPNLLPLRAKIETFVSTFSELQPQPQSQQQLKRIQDEINLLRPEQDRELVLIQSIQHQLQGQLVTEITNLQTRQVYIETEVIKVGLTSATLPALTVLRAEVARLSTYLQLLQTQQTPDDLIRIRGEVAHQLTQQQQALVIIQIYSFLFSEYTSCATHRRIASYGAFFAGKMMEYFFDEYIQLPSFFKYFESYLKHCFQYSTTTLIYDADVPPYNLIQIPPGSSFTLPFTQYFQKMGIVLFVPGAHLDGSANARYILETLQEKTSYIKAISHFLTKDFMKDTGALDDLSRVSSGESVSTASSASSASSARSDGSMLSQESALSTTSSFGSKSFCGFDTTNMGSVSFFLLAASLDGSESGVSFNPGVHTQETDLGDVPEATEMGGGNKPRLATVATTKRNRKYKSRSSPKRKSKSNNKSNNKSKSRHKRNSKITNKTFCRKRKSYLSRKPHKKQTLKKGVKR